MINFPKKSEPLRVEFELTNHCNATCIFCPRDRIKEKGYMNIDEFSQFLKKLKLFKQEMTLNQTFQENYPILVFGGYGEALLHPAFFLFLSIAKKEGFKTELITNGFLLKENIVKKLIEYKIDKVALSLHTLNPQINKKITLLPDVIPIIEKALEQFDKSEVNIEIWRVSNFDGTLFDENSAESYKNFLNKYTKEIAVLGPTPAWNRGGQYNSNYHPLVNDSKQIRCQTMFFNWSISFNGDVVLCCCDFSGKTTILATNWNINFDEIQEKILFFQKQKPKMCQNCRKPKDNYYQELYKTEFP